MLPNLFAHPLTLITGGIVGIIFGFLIQKAGLSQFPVIIGQLLLKNFIPLKTFLTAIIVGSIGIYAILALDLPLTLHIKKASVLAVLLGGSIFGTGVAILGYSPAGCIAAAGQGSSDAWWGIFGMLIGTAVYAVIYPLVQTSIIPTGMMLDTTLPTALNISPWIIIAILSIGSILFFRVVGKKQSS